MSLASDFERLLKMRLLVVFLLMALIVLPTEGLFRRRRRRRWLRIRGSKVLKGIGIAAKLGLLGKRDVQDDLASADLNEDGNIDQSEAENLFDKRDAEQILNLVDIDGDSVVSHDEFIRGMEDLFSQGDE
ncbi:uncharacterized protein LOC124140002 [Haliotis rufescens]|uniref:uncharacterized protein LOC124140002 n=1 Tax=Haliotis rufescens TaxID=6454 RepID=UPI00201FA236|nr:uncharacterized protein LOC124140002 [Haliotis rufescens]